MYFIGLAVWRFLTLTLGDNSANMMSNQASNPLTWTGHQKHQRIRYEYSPQHFFLVHLHYCCSALVVLVEHKLVTAIDYSLQPSLITNSLAFHYQRSSVCPLKVCNCCLVYEQREYTHAIHCIYRCCAQYEIHEYRSSGQLSIPYTPTKGELI